jgi:hypothetical protein
MRYISAEDARPGDIVCRKNDPDPDNKGYVITPTADDMLLVAWTTPMPGPLYVWPIHWSKVALIQARG